MANKNVKLKDGSDYLFPQTTVENITDLTATATELNYCDGVTSNVQTQLDAKQATLTAGTGMDLTSNTATVTGTQYKNASGTAQANALKFVKCTQAEYTALGTYDNDTFYIIVG